MLIKSNFMSKSILPNAAAKLRISEHITKKKDSFVDLIVRKCLRCGKS